MAWTPGTRVRASGMCDGCGCMMGCLQRAVGADLAIGFMSDVAVSAATALHAGFGDITQRILGSAHRPEDQEAMLELGQMDILLAGFPCTPISNANRRSTLVTEDGRQLPLRREQLERLLSLIWTSLAYAEHTRPRFILLETVGALRDSLEMRQVFLRLEETLCTRLPGYHWSFTRSNAADAGSINERDRLWIMGAAPASRALSAAVSAMTAMADGCCT
jgi:site-specific DNA-cytosine methylase